MRGIAAELPDLRKGRFQPRDHVIEGIGETADFVGGAFRRQALCEVSCGNTLRRHRDRIDGSQGTSGQEPAARQRNDQRDGRHHHQDTAENGAGFPRRLPARCRPG